MNQVIRVLVVDDSAFVRKVVREMLSRSPYIEVVGVARDGDEGLDLAEQLKPDVITCDLVMPRMDGITFVREQMSRRRVPILVLTSTPEDGEKALQALDAGAVDIVQKPSALANDQLLSIREELVEKIKALGHAPMVAEQPVAEPQFVLPKPTVPSRIKVVVIGISTGGPQALRYMLPQFPVDFPVPIAIVLHMPVGYTEMFAAKLDELSALKVVEAKAGMELCPGTAILAQAGRHLVLRQENDKVFTDLSVAPLTTPHRPAADVLFRSAADCFRSGVLGVVMTGMGDDGKEGSAWIKAQGGIILTEAEESCVIYGMPRSVVEAGLSDAAIPLSGMAKKIIEQL